MKNDDENNELIGSQSEENDDWISKSQIKREAEDLKGFGEFLVSLSLIQLQKLPLNETLFDAILLAQKLKLGGSRRRQLQLIGKILRDYDDLDALKSAVNLLKNHTPQQRLMKQKMEKWCDDFITDDNDTIERFIALYPDCDRQHLRSLVRNTQKEQKNGAAGRAYQQLLQYLKLHMLPL